MILKSIHIKLRYCNLSFFSYIHCKCGIFLLNIVYDDWKERSIYEYGHVFHIGGLDIHLFISVLLISVDLVMVHLRFYCGIILPEFRHLCCQYTPEHIDSTRSAFTLFLWYGSNGSVWNWLFIYPWILRLLNLPYMVPKTFP